MVLTKNKNVQLCLRKYYLNFPSVCLVSMLSLPSKITLFKGHTENGKCHLGTFEIFHDHITYKRKIYFKVKKQ